MSFLGFFFVCVLNYAWLSSVIFFVANFCVHFYQCCPWKTVSLDYLGKEFSCWVCQLSLGCVKIFVLETWSSPHFYPILHLRETGNKKKKNYGHWYSHPFPTFLFWEFRSLSEKMPLRVSSREPQLKPRCPASDLRSDKLEHILLRKDIILLLVLILVLVSLVEVCVMWDAVYPEWLWETPTQSIISLLLYCKKRVTQMTCAFIWSLW